MKTEAEVREYLSAHKVPQFIDAFVQQLVLKQPDDFKPLMREMLECSIRTHGKGAKAQVLFEAHKAGNQLKPKALKYGGGVASTLEMEDYDVPAYARRDPKLKPTLEQVVRGGVVKWPETRSVIKHSSKRADYSSTVAAVFNYSAGQCMKVCEQIVAECVKQQKPFFDDEWWLGLRTTMYPKGAPADCTVTEPKEAMRMTALYPKAPIFVSGSDSNDIVQGAIGDCFFIGAVSSLAAAKSSGLDPLRRLVVFSDQKWGVYGVMLFKNAGWEWVICDDYVAVCRDQQGAVFPQYAAPGTEPELWPLIIEKAYAKMHYAWDTIDGGWEREALEDLTGGLGFTLDLYKRDKTEWANNFARFKSVCEDPLTVLGCAVGNQVSERSGGATGRSGESGAILGLFKGHAYSIIKAQQTSDGQGFVRVRNPWGNDAEWQGAYGDRSPDWGKNPLHKRELNPEIKDDGAFWMKWEDFRSIFTDIDVMRFFPYDWVTFSMFGTSPKLDVQASNTYILHIAQKTKFVVSICQDDPKTKLDHRERKSSNYITMQLSIHRLKELPSSFNDLERCFVGKEVGPKGKSRVLFHEIEAEEGYYAIVPQFLDASGIGFCLRVLGVPTVHMALWRFSEGKGKALTAAGAVTSAQTIEAVAVSVAPTEAPQGEYILAPADRSDNANKKELLAKKTWIFICCRV